MEKQNPISQVTDCFDTFFNSISCMMCRDVVKLVLTASDHACMEINLLIVRAINWCFVYVWYVFVNYRL